MDPKELLGQLSALGVPTISPDDEDEKKKESEFPSFWEAMGVDPAPGLGGDSQPPAQAPEPEPVEPPPVVPEAVKRRHWLDPILEGRSHVEPGSGPTGEMVEADELTTHRRPGVLNYLTASTEADQDVMFGKEGFVSEYGVQPSDPEASFGGKAGLTSEELRKMTHFRSLELALEDMNETDEGYETIKGEVDGLRPQIDLMVNELDQDLETAGDPRHLRGYRRKKRLGELAQEHDVLPSMFGGKTVLRGVGTGLGNVGTGAGNLVLRTLSFAEGLGGWVLPGESSGDWGEMANELGRMSRLSHAVGREKDSSWLQTGVREGIGAITEAGIIGSASPTGPLFSGLTKAKAMVDAQRIGTATKALTAASVSRGTQAKTSIRAITGWFGATSANNRYGESVDEGYGAFPSSVHAATAGGVTLLAMGVGGRVGERLGVSTVEYMVPNLLRGGGGKFFSDQVTGKLPQAVGKWVAAVGVGAGVETSEEILEAVMQRGAERIGGYGRGEEAFNFDSMMAEILDLIPTTIFAGGGSGGISRMPHTLAEIDEGFGKAARNARAIKRGAETASTVVLDRLDIAKNDPRRSDPEKTIRALIRSPETREQTARILDEIEIPELDSMGEISRARFSATTGIDKKTNGTERKAYYYSIKGWKSFVDIAEVLRAREPDHTFADESGQILKMNEKGELVAEQVGVPYSQADTEAMTSYVAMMDRMREDIANIPGPYSEEFADSVAEDLGFTETMKTALDEAKSKLEAEERAGPQLAISPWTSEANPDSLLPFLGPINDAIKPETQNFNQQDILRGESPKGEQLGSGPDVRVGAMPETLTVDELGAMTIKDLRALAGERGLQLKSRVKKAEIVQSLHQHMLEGPGSAPASEFPLAATVPPETPSVPTGPGGELANVPSGDIQAKVWGGNASEEELLAQTHKTLDDLADSVDLKFRSGLTKPKKVEVLREHIAAQRDTAEEAEETVGPAAEEDAKWGDWKTMISSGYKGSRETPPQTVEEIIHFLNPSGKAKQTNPGMVSAAMTLYREKTVDPDAVNEALGKINAVGWGASLDPPIKKPAAEFTDEDMERVHEAVRLRLEADVEVTYDNDTLAETLLNEDQPYTVQWTDSDVGDVSVDLGQLERLISTSTKDVPESQALLAKARLTQDASLAVEAESREQVADDLRRLRKNLPEGGKARQILVPDEGFGQRAYEIVDPDGSTRVAIVISQEGSYGRFTREQWIQRQAALFPQYDPESGEDISAEYWSGQQPAGGFRLVSRVPYEDAEQAGIDWRGMPISSQRDGEMEISGGGLVFLLNSLDSDQMDVTIAHEQVHWITAMGKWTPREWKGLVEKHSDPTRSRRQQEEDIALSSQYWKPDTKHPSLLQKVRKKLKWMVGFASEISGVDYAAQAEQAFLSGEVLKRQGKDIATAIDEMEGSYVSQQQNSLAAWDAWVESGKIPEQETPGVTAHVAGKLNLGESLTPDEEAYLKGNRVKVHSYLEAREELAKARDKKQRELDFGSDVQYATIPKPGEQRQPWFSAMHKAMERFPQKTSTPSQLRSWLQKQPGVKKQEAIESGLLDYLKGMEQEGKKVSKDDVLAFMETGGGIVRVEEILKSASVPNLEWDYGPTVDPSHPEPGTRVWTSSARVPTRQGHTELIEWEIEKKSFVPRPGWSGEGFALLQQGMEEEHVYPTLERAQAAAQEEVAARSHQSLEHPDQYIEGGKNRREFQLVVPDSSIEGRPPEDPETYDKYQSPHWRQGNVVVAIRMTDRTNSKGQRLLHIDEMQSDPHQAGRRVGYIGDQIEFKELDSLAPRSSGATRVYQYEFKREDFGSVKFFGPRSGWWWAVWEPAADSVHEESAKRYKTREEAEAAAQEMARLLEDRVPDLPFKGNAWKKLAMRRMIKFAADNNYDKLTWTTADMQVELYGTPVVRWKPASEGPAGTVTFGVSDADAVDLDDLTNRWVAQPEDLTVSNIAEKLREADVQNEVQVAKKLLARMKDEPKGKFEPRREGMAGFYDKELVNIANDILKKELDKDVRVGKTEIYTMQDADTTPWGEGGPPSDAVSLANSIDITDKVSDGTAQGMPLYATVPIRQVAHTLAESQEATEAIQAEKRIVQEGHLATLRARRAEIEADYEGEKDKLLATIGGRLAEGVSVEDVLTDDDQLAFVTLLRLAGDADRASWEKGTYGQGPFNDGGKANRDHRELLKYWNATGTKAGRLLHARRRDPDLPEEVRRKEELAAALNDVVAISQRSATSHLPWLDPRGKWFRWPNFDNWTARGFREFRSRPLDPQTWKNPLKLPEFGGDIRMRVHQSLARMEFDVSDLQGIANDEDRSIDFLNQLFALTGRKRDAVYEYWRNSIMSGPETQAVNLLGTAAHMGYSMFAHRFVTAGLGAVGRAVGVYKDTDVNAATFREFGYIFHGMEEAFSKGFEAAIKTWRNERSHFDHLWGQQDRSKDYYVSSWKSGERREGHRAEFVNMPPAGPEIAGAAGKLVRMFGFRPSALADDFIKTVGQHMERNMLAARIARAQTGKGWGDPEFNSVFEDQVSDRASASNQAAVEKALRGAFQGGRGILYDKMAFAQKIQKTDVINYFHPFHSTPINLYDEVVNHLPILGIYTGYRELQNDIGARAKAEAESENQLWAVKEHVKERVAKKKMSQKTADELVAKAEKKAKERKDATFRGTNMLDVWARQAISLGFLGFLYATNDPEDPWITGNLTSTNWKWKKLAFETGYAPMTIKVPEFASKILGLPDSRLDYRRLEPFASIAGILVDAHHSWARSDHWSDKVTGILQAGLGQVDGKPFLDGMSDAVGLYTDLAEGGLRNTVFKWGTDMAVSFVPNVYRQSSRRLGPDTVPEQRIWGTGEDLVNLVPRRFFQKAHLHFFEGEEWGWAPPLVKYDSWGYQVSKRPPGKDAKSPLAHVLLKNSFIPTKIHYTSGTHRVSVALWNYNAKKKPEDQLFLMSPQNFWKDRRTKEVHHLTEKQWQNYQKYVGIYARKRVNAADAMKAGNLVKDIENPTEKEIEYIKKMYSRANTVIRKKLIPQWRKGKEGTITYLDKEPTTR